MRGNENIMSNCSPKRHGRISSVEGSSRELKRKKEVEVNLDDNDWGTPSKSFVLQEMKDVLSVPEETVESHFDPEFGIRDEEANRTSEIENYFMQGRTHQINRAWSRRSKRMLLPHQPDPNSYEEAGDEESVKDGAKKSFSCCNIGALRGYISNSEVSEQNKDQVAKIKQDFQWWAFCLAAGFNMLLYGVGSKRTLVNDFCKEQLSEFCTLTIDGFSEDVTTKMILTNIIEFLNLKHCEQKRSSLIEWAKHIAATIELNQQQLIVILHNIDGPNLRDPLDQYVLAALVENPSILMLATVDHINATLLHTTRQIESFKWIYYRADTFEFPSKELLSGRSSLLGLNPKSSNLAHSLSSLDVLWKSLATNSRAIFRLFFSLFFSNKVPVAFWDLFNAAKDEFLVSSDTALRQQLVEFSDHRILRWTRGDDGNERLVGLLEKSLVEKFFTEKGLNLDIP